MRSLAIDKSLEGIAGYPIGELTSPGLTPNLNLPSASPRTIYFVIYYDGTVSVTPLVTLGNENMPLTSHIVGGQVVRSLNITGNNNTLVHRIYSLEGNNDTIIFGSNLNRSKFITGCVWLGASSTGYHILGQLASTKEFASNSTMINNPKLGMNSGANQNNKYAAVYNSIHSNDIRVRIMSLLAFKYGSV